MHIELPYSLADWEEALTRYFLMASGDDVGPIRSFDISPETLALAAGADASAGVEAVASFKKALLSGKSALYSALEDGSYNGRLVPNCPGCFIYLALTIFVESQRTGTDGSDEFRPKLAEFLGVDRSFSNLSGVAIMWRLLRDWLAREANVGKPLRKLVLPADDGRVQIGYSLRLSFPSRRDHTFLGHFFDQHPGITADEHVMLATLRNLVDRASASPGLHDAFDEFYGAYLRGQRTLADHRFWKFVLTVAAARSLDLPAEVSLETYSDEDGLLQFKIEVAGKPGGQSVHSTLQSAVDAVAKLGASNLGKVTEAGYVVFKRLGTARWAAVPRFSDCRGDVKVGLCRRLALGVGSRLGTLRASGEWSMTIGTVPIAKAEDILRRLFAKVEMQSLVSRVVVTGGVRTDHHWLGRRTLLPRIENDLGLPTLTSRGTADAAEPVCEEIGPNLYAIQAARPLSGIFELRCGATTATRLQFVADAFLYESRPPANVVDLPEWNDIAELRSRVSEPPRDWEDVAEPLDDLIEAIYAGGHEGWSEADLVPLFERTLPPQINCWDFLRSLQDATVLTPFLRAQFRGRSWVLGPATLVPLRSRAGDFVLVDGCVPALQVREFRLVVQSLGGRAFRRAGSYWSIPVIGAEGVSADKLHGALGWPTKTAIMPGRRPAAFGDAPLRRLDAYRQVCVWSWEAGRFTSGGSHSPVRLARWAHRGERDHDVYVVSGPTQERRFVSRCSAIVYAHMLAGRAMYRFEAGQLVRVGRDGFLPSPISHWLRYENLANAVTLHSSSYGYTACHEQAVVIAALLPGVVEVDAPLRASWEVIATARRSGFAERLVFADGRFVSARSPFDPT